MSILKIPQNSSKLPEIALTFLSKYVLNLTKEKEMAHFFGFFYFYFKIGHP